MTTDRPLPEHVTTPLLTLITARSLDEDYQLVARQRAQGDAPARDPGRKRFTTGVAVAVLGLLLAVAALQSQRDAQIEQLGRAALIDQIEAERASLGSLEDRSASLASDVRRAQLDLVALDEQERALTANQRRFEATTGYGAVRGPGVRIRVTNPPDADANTEIRDEDLATLVDGLWQAGAEAIAINGQRLTALTGIRNTGRAIHVGGNPVTPPYGVDVIGEPSSLQGRLLESSQGAAWFVLVRTFGFEYSAENVSEDDIRLPAAELRALRQTVPPRVSDNDSKPGKEDSTP